MLATMASINDVLQRAQGNDTPVTCRIDNEDVSMVAVRITVQTLLLGKEGISILVSLIIILLLPLGLPENRERDSLNFFNLLVYAIRKAWCANFLYPP